MTVERKISKFYLLLHGFKLSDEDINIWTKQVPIKHSHDVMIYNYHWKERILKYICYDCIGYVQYTGQIDDEQKAYNEILTI